MHTFRTYAVLAAMALGVIVCAQKKPLDPSAFDGWRSVVGTTLSRDGKWVLYRLNPQDGDAVLEIQRSDGGKTIQIPRASVAQFSQDGKYVLATVIPPIAEMKKARRDKVKPEDQPKNALTIVDLSTGGQASFPKVTSFTLPEEDSGWFAYKPEPPKPEPAKPEAKKEEPKPAETKPAETKPAEKKPEDKKPTKKADHKAGDPLVIRNLSTGDEIKLEDVASFRFSKNGKVLVYVVSTKDGSGDGVVWYDLPSNKKTTVVTGMGHYPRLALDKEATKLAFLSDKDDYAAKKPSHTLFLFRPGASLETIAKEGTAGLLPGFWIPDNSTVRFSEKGGRLLFSTAPKPPEEKKDDTPDDEKVSVDVWNWQDGILQPQQLLQAASERLRTYDAVYFFDTKKITSLESPELPSVTLSDKEDGDIAIGSTSKPYEILASWDTSYRDVYFVDVRTGSKKAILKKSPMGLALSPTGKYAVGYDPIAKQFLSFETKSGASHVLNQDIKVAIWDELNDVPSPADSLGYAGWTPNDERILLYDRYDIWSVDPLGKSPSVNVTNGFGRSSNTRLRYLRLDPEADFIDPAAPMLLSSFNFQTKDAGFYRDRVTGNGYPEKILTASKLFSAPTKAKSASTMVFTRQDFVEYPNVWISEDGSLTNAKKLSDANPQQSQYNWGKTEIVEWTSNDGVPLQGILIKPEDFDYAKKYPMITYFYERNSDTLNAYRTPAPTASILNPTYAASNGYIVFIPDIPYKEGYPGESAVSAILPGVQSILTRGYVDPKRLAIDGQSWGGYQVAYLVTETNLFRCAYAGAPVADMFSAYGGIRWGSGLVREFQYEKEQSRIAGNPWEKPLRYLENSPLFFLDKVQTPLLIMSNDKDGAVPWYQGIELFTGLRRLQRPSWLLVYNNEDHNLVERKNRKDLTIRKQQFFDFYLKDAPMPVWMKSGIPAVDKGKTMGLELTKGL